MGYDIQALDENDQYLSNDVKGPDYIKKQKAAIKDLQEKLEQAK